MTVQVKLMGQAAITTGAARLEPPPGKSTAILYYLAYQPGWVSRDDLLHLFYPDLGEHEARQNLRPILSKLRRLAFTEALEIEPARLRWNVETDIQAVRFALQENRLAQAVQRYRGPLLEGFKLLAAPEFESWLGFERSELHSRWREACLSVAAQLESEGRHSHASEVLARLHKADPLDEEVFRRYLSALARAERPADAFKAFETFKATLAREVEGEPDEATHTLVEQIRQGQLPSLAFQKLETPKPLLKIPTPTTTFVGREADVAEMLDALNEPACRLLSIVAPGGMGKTRLALEVAKRLAPDFRDGVCFVPFHAVAAPELMLPAIADALSFAFFGVKDPKEQLLEHLQAKTMLLVLDNLEHLLSGVGLVAEMLERAPGLKLLCTSRERLDLHAEWLYDLAGMAVTRQSDANPQDADAVKLFIQTAKRARADFRLDNDAATVAQICGQLGGMPLAIELAAGWLRVLNVDEIAGELGKGLGLLESSLRDLPARHHDMRTVFDTSWERLSAHEQTALQKLAVFHGGFTREAALEVADVSLPLLLALGNKSFLRREASGRFAQHPLLWQYLREKAIADAETFAQSQAKHAAYFAAFMHEREALHRSIEARAVQATLENDLANLREAWFWATDYEREDLLDQAAETLTEIHMSAGRYDEGEALFVHAADKLRSQSVIHGRILRRLGHFNNLQLKFEAGAGALKASIAIFQRHGAKPDEATALNFLWHTFAFSNHPEADVEPLALAALSLLREVGNKHEEAVVLGNLAERYRDPQQRERCLREAIRLFREVGDHSGINLAVTLTLCNLARSQAAAYGAYEEANDLIMEAIAIERQQGMAFRLAWWLNYQGVTSLERGQLEAAQAQFAEAHGVAETLESGFGMWEHERALHGLGLLSQLRGDAAEARRLFTRSLELNSRHADPMTLKLPISLSLSKLELAEGNIGEALAYCQKTQVGERHFQALSSSALARAAYLNQLGQIALAQGNLAGAAERAHEALSTAEAWGFMPMALELCVSFAALHQGQGDEKRAATLLALAAHHPASMYETKVTARRRLEGLAIINEGLEPFDPPTLEKVARALRSS